MNMKRTTFPSLPRFASLLSLLMFALTMSLTSCHDDDPVNPVGPDNPDNPDEPDIPTVITYTVKAEPVAITATTATVSLSVTPSEGTFAPEAGDSLGIFWAPTEGFTLEDGTGMKAIAFDGTAPAASFSFLLHGFAPEGSVVVTPFVTMKGERTLGTPATVATREVKPDELTTLAATDAEMPHVTLNASINLEGLGVDTLTYDAGSRLGFVVGQDPVTLCDTANFQAVALTDGLFSLPITDYATLDTLYYASAFYFADGVRALYGPMQAFTFADTDLLTMATDTITLTKKASSFTIPFSSTRSWSVAVNAESAHWLTVDAAEGDGTLEGLLTFQALANDSLAREAVVTMTAGTKEASFVVTQAAGNLLSVTPAEVTAPKSDTTIVVLVSCSHLWKATVAKDVDWITVEPDNGQPGLDTEVAIHVAANKLRERKGTITFLADGKRTTLTVTQADGCENDEDRYEYIGTWPQSAISPSRNSFCGGELSKLTSKFSGNSYYSGNHMGQAFERDNQNPTLEQIKWLQDYKARPASMDGFSKWTARSVKLYPFGKPLPADCNQHSIGDCNTVSTLADMAYLYPDFIMSLIEQVNAQNFRVKMFDPKGNRIVVCVDNYFLADGNGNVVQMTGKNNTITWSAILEKAIMKWFTVYRPSAQLGGFGAEGMTPLFTGDGRSVAVSPGKCSAKELQQIVTTCLRHGLIVNGGFNKGGLKLDKHETITGHGHSFLLPNKEGALFAIRNPWGQGSDDHVMQCMDDGIVPPTIDLRIISPGIASVYYPGEIKPYEIPKW